MKIHIEYNGAVFVFEHHPMPEGRFRTLCRLVAAGIGGTVFLVALKLAGIAAIIGAVVALLLVGAYKSMLI